MRIWIFFVTVSAASFGPFTNSSICSTVVQCQQTYAANTSLPHTPVVAISSTREPISNTTAKPKEAVKVQATSAGNGTISKAKVTSSNTKTAWSFVTDDPNKGLPRTGTGSKYASMCNSLSQDYSRSERSYDSSNNNVLKTATTRTILSLTTHYTFTSFYTECDRHVRVKGKITQTSIETSTVLQTGSIHTSKFSHQQPRPDCTIQRDDCSMLWKEYYATTTSRTQSPPRPSCKADCGPCYIDGGTVELFYSPVPNTVERDLCATEHYGDEPKPRTVTTNQGYIVTRDMTMELKSAYISFATASATDSCGRTIGRVHTGTIIPIDSKDVSTMRLFTLNVGRRADFADFNKPVPITALRDVDSGYSGWMGCDAWDSRTCQSVLHGPNQSAIQLSSLLDDEVYQTYAGPKILVEDEYHPTLVAPLQIRSMDPEWASCALPLQGIYDPPIVLEPASALIMKGPEPTLYSPAESPRPPTAVPVYTPTMPTPTGNGDPGDRGHGEIRNGDQNHGNGSPGTTQIVIVQIGDKLVEVQQLPNNGGIILPDGTTITPGESREIEGAVFGVGPAILVNGQPIAPMASAGTTRLGLGLFAASAFPALQTRTDKNGVCPAAIVIKGDQACPTATASSVASSVTGSRTSPTTAQTRAGQGKDLPASKDQSSAVLLKVHGCLAPMLFTIAAHVMWGLLIG